MAELSRAIASLQASKSPATRFRVKEERKDDDVTEIRAEKTLPMVRHTKVDWNPEDISSRIKRHREPRSFINPDGEPRDTGSIPWSIPSSPLMDSDFHSEQSEFPRSSGSLSVLFHCVVFFRV